MNHFQYLHFSMISIVVFSFFSMGIEAQKLPKLPTTPKEPEVKTQELDPRGEKKNDKMETGSQESTSNPDPKDRTKKREIQIELCDGRKLQGSWEEKEKEIQFHHTKEGIRYRKSLATQDLATIRILSWTATQPKQDKEGVAYRMIPSQVLLKTRSGETYEKDMGLEGTEYSILKVENAHGTATVYSIWMDLLYKDGQWYSKLERIPPDRTRTDCHRDVVREIRFP